MRTAYDILNVATSATNEDIKQAYLQNVHDFPPEQAPQQFQLIRNAYDAIKTARQRAEYALLEEPKVILPQLLADHLPTGKARRPNLKIMLQALSECV